MDEYISKQIFKEKYLCCGWLPEISEEEFDAFPAADVVEVRHGRWVNHFDYMMERSGFFVCDSCKKMSREKYDYCPNCGARMNKEDEHEAD